jgi:hypothetical protein
MNRTFARRRLRELFAPIRDRAEGAAGRQPTILHAIRTVALVEGYDLTRERLLHQLVAQSGWTTHTLLYDVFIDEEEA